MTGINTIIFDMDGTVLNTLDDLTDSVNHVLSLYQMPLRSREEYRLFFGNGIRYALTRAVPENTPDSLINEMISAFKTYYDRHCLDQTRPYDGVPELMSELKKNGYKMAIVSNKIDSAVKELNDRFFSEYVDVAIGEKAGIKRKPAPDTVLAALVILLDDDNVVPVLSILADKNARLVLKFMQSNDGATMTSNVIANRCGISTEDAVTALNNLFTIHLVNVQQVEAGEDNPINVYSCYGSYKMHMLVYPILELSRTLYDWHEFWMGFRC